MLNRIIVNINMSPFSRCLIAMGSLDSLLLYSRVGIRLERLYQVEVDCCQTLGWIMEIWFICHPWMGSQLHLLILLCMKPWMRISSAVLQLQLQLQHRVPRFHWSLILKRMQLIPCFRKWMGWYRGSVILKGTLQNCTIITELGT